MARLLTRSGAPFWNSQGAIWFIGDFENVHDQIATYFWNMPLEDNGFLLLRTHTGQAAFLHASWTEWKNTFSFEIYGRTGKLEISGLGRNYVVEQVTFIACRPRWERLKRPRGDPMADDCWEVEFREFPDRILAYDKKNRTPRMCLIDYGLGWRKGRLTIWPHLLVRADLAA